MQNANNKVTHAHNTYLANAACELFVYLLLIGVLESISIQLVLLVFALYFILATDNE